MIENIKHTFKHTIIYSIGNFSIKLIGLVLLPIYTTYFSISEYGIMSILEITQNIIASIVSLNIADGIKRFYNDTQDEDLKGKYLFLGLVYVVVVSIVLNLFLQPFTKSFSLLFFKDAGKSVLFKLLFINSALYILTRYIRNYYNIIENSIKVSLFNFLQFLILLFFIVLFVVFFKLKLKGWLYAQIVTSIIIIVIFGQPIIKKLKFSKQLVLLKRILSFSAPLSVSSLASVILSYGDRYVLNFLLGQSYVGIYTFALRIVNFVDLLVIQAFHLSYTPFSFKIYKSKNFKVFHSKITTYVYFVLILFSLSIVLFAKEVIVIFSYKNPQYWDAFIYIPLLMLTKIFVYFRYIFSLSLHITKKTKIIPLIVISAGLINLGLDILIVPKFGINGAILASLLSFTLMDSIYYYFAQRYFPVKYEFGRMILLTIIAIGIYFISYFVSFTSLVWNLVFKGVLIISYLLLLWWLGFFTEDELEVIKGFVRKWGNPATWKQNLKDFSKNN